MVMIMAETQMVTCFLRHFIRVHPLIDKYYEKFGQLFFIEIKNGLMHDIKSSIHHLYIKRLKKV